MIDLIKQSAVPAIVMRSAARGALSLPAEEMVEILVFLTANHVFAEQAKLALAGFDQREMIRIAADSATPPEVLLYLASPENLRPSLVSTLIENPSLPASKLLEIGMSHSHEALEAMVASPRVRSDSAALHVLVENAQLPTDKRAQLKVLLESLQTSPVDDSKEEALSIDNQAAKYAAEHAAEIAAEEAKGFELTDLSEDEKKVSEKAGLKLNILKNKIMALGSITS